MRNQPIRCCGVLIAAALLSCLVATEAEAQLFGERNLGGGLRRGAAPGQQGPANGGMELRSIDPERFTRGQRPPDAFVGGQVDPTADFVGREIPAGGAAIRSAIDGTVPRQPARRSAQINRPLPPTPRNTLAPPRLAIEPATVPAVIDDPALETPLLTREALLTDVLVRRISPSASVRIDNRRALLDGTVSSDDQRQLAEIMIRFEPGIDEVVNRLEIVGSD